METVGIIVGMAKWLGAGLVALILGIIGWNVKNMHERMDRTEAAFQKHEVESAEKFGRLVMAFESATTSMCRIERYIEGVANDVKEALRK